MFPKLTNTLIFVYIWLIFCGVFASAKLPVSVAQWAITEFEAHEANISKISFRGIDRRSALPFISGDGFRSYCKHICEDHNRCRMSPEDVKDGDAIFVKTDFLDFFANSVISRINASYYLITHNGDLSAPDGQNDAPRIGMPRYVASDKLLVEYQKKKLISHHGQNIWWVNKTDPRPAFSHCLPIGFENRQWNIGKNVKVYVEALKQFVINRASENIDDSERPLLLIAFYPKSRVPDRHKVLSILNVFPPKGQKRPDNPFWNYTDLNHWEWLEAVTHHKFVLAPFGHGLDTHRISEILMMGGIPVMRKSSISSCYDNSDNTLHGKTRGSLPVVIVDKWEDVTKERLDQEWERLKNIPDTTWDYKRVFMYHWIERIFGQVPPQVHP